MQYKIGFWNYVDTGVLSPEDAVKDWRELGMNLPMSFEFDPAKHDKQEATALLNACEKNGMKVIFCDARTRFDRLKQVGEKEFAHGVLDAARDFAAHPAFYGFHVGDEPDRILWNTATRAFQIVKEATPNAHTFINFLPYWDEPNFADCVADGIDGYAQILDAFLTETGTDILAYDYYGQGGYFERERFVDLYFQNLNMFGRLARKHGAELFPSLLSVGHWSLTVPNEDLLRWQISTAVAHGATGLMWFFVYERTYDGSFRTAPVDLFYHRTETFDRLARQNNTFMRFFADRLAPYSFDAVWHIGKQYGGTPAFVPSADIRSVETVVNPVPTAITRFKADEGKACYAVTNLSQTEPTAVIVHGKESFGGMNEKIWLAPGQMFLITESK